MRYTKEERLEIGKKVYSYELSISEAAEQYNLNWYTVRTYMRQYRELNHLPNMSAGKPIKESNPADINELLGNTDVLNDDMLKLKEQKKVTL